MVIGVDDYQENPSSHDWGPSLNVHMALLSMNEWTEGLEKAGFVDVEAVQVGAKEGWSGTLVITRTVGQIDKTNRLTKGCAAS